MLACQKGRSHPDKTPCIGKPLQGSQGNFTATNLASQKTGERWCLRKCDSDLICAIQKTHSGYLGKEESMLKQYELKRKRED